MLEITITEDHVTQAERMAQEMGHLRNSITKGDGNIAGFLGELLLCELIGGEQSNTYDYDVIMANGKTVDVKTKRTTVEPKVYYECSVAALNTTQKCDYYAFMRVKEDFSAAWFLGMVDKNRYFELSTFLKKGEKDPDNGYIVKSDCYNLAIDKL